MDLTYPPEAEAQFLPGILRGEIAWCQAFSEPDAGSDLGGLKSRAELDGDEWVVNGQKVWTTQAQHADHCFVLARTDPEAPKHEGISYLLVDIARRNGRAADPLIRQRLAIAWSKVKIMEINGLRSLSDVLHGTKQAAALGPLNKMFWSEYHRDTMELAMDVLGMEGELLTGSDEETFVAGIGRRRGRPGYPVGPLQASFFFSRSETIWGGTAEIQRNIVGERVLGLPKEPRASS